MPRGFSAISILSLVLCLAALAMWARSYTRNDELLLGHAMATSERGTVAISVWLPNKGFAVVTVNTARGTRHETGHAHPTRSQRTSNIMSATRLQNHTLHFAVFGNSFIQFR